jgi:hypothetical protein
MPKLFGDMPGSVTDKQRGSDNTFVGIDDTSNSLEGDAVYAITNNARGGNDTLRPARGRR